jgi:hypothetical protein
MTNWLESKLAFSGSVAFIQLVSDEMIEQPV